MSDGTKIEWTHRPGTIPSTMNALVGCQKVSQGCAHCYAIEVAHVRAGNLLPIFQEKFGGTTKVEGGKPVWTGKVTLTEKALLAPLRAKKPHTYFVNAMSDLFYDGVPDEAIDRHFAVFALCPQHTFIVLTKRPERMLEYLAGNVIRDGGVTRGFISERYGRPGRFFPQVKSLPLNQDVAQMPWPLPNVWLGVSVEDQATADARIPLLLQAPAAVRFISYEPALGSLDLGNIDAFGLDRALGREPSAEELEEPWKFSALEASDMYHGGSGGISDGPEHNALDWVICGGESGKGARPMHPDWARSVRDQCVAAGVPFFFKQWGEWIDGANSGNCVFPDGGTGIAMDHKFHVKAFDHGDWLSVPDDHVSEDDFGCLMYRVGKKAAGNLLDGKVWQQFPR